MQCGLAGLCFTLWLKPRQILLKHLGLVFIVVYTLVLPHCEFLEEPVYDQFVIFSILVVYTPE